ncbi:molybdopterin-dependent oxidoreductase [Deferrisoma camini]|uniref:molybdopterin-dependent oxidoreductase n=1 Tax=Deferrisoma camini TaxID=1035120 RepID=UPI0004A243D6|nr:molybdopterin-dependent oxidoreductase [Deferrisoma camini]
MDRKQIAENAQVVDEKGVSRRGFLKCGAFLGGSAILASKLGWAVDLVRRAEAGQLKPGEELELARAENVLYSVCLQCHTACTIQGRILDGVLVKIGGNPYSPMNLLPQLPYATSPFDAARVEARLCPKGQAGIQSLYDPYRIVKVLKRAGKRGENKWRVIPFHQAVDEIVNGGYLFSDVPGEERRYVKGLRETYALRDAKLAKAMAADAKAVAKKKMTVAEFKKRYADHLDLLIDPDHPDLGPKNNRFVFMAGRIEHGRKEFAKRWLKDSFGSVNWYEHTTICEQSHHIAYNEMTRAWKKGKWGKGKHHMKPDALNSRYILFFGTGAFEANFGPTNMAEKITEGIASGRLKIAVADPRFSKTAAKASKWLPLKPGTDAALAFGMIRWILDSKRYDERYLRSANKAAAHEAGETTWTNATWLVKIGEDGPGALLRADEAGVGDKDEFVVAVDGKLAAVAPNSGKDPVVGDLYHEGEVNGVRVKSVFQLLTERASARSVAEWAEECGLPASDVEAVAKEFTSYGKQAVAELYRGPVQHTNGYYNGQAIITLNLLVGNPDWKGGLQKGGGHWHEDGSKKDQPFNLKKLYASKLKSFGVTLTREKHRYEESTLFEGYPAKRCWYPFTGNVYQEIIPSAGMGYPYSIDALFLHKGTPAFSAPAGDKNIQILQDLERVPLLFACDIVIGETSMYADYLFPDTAIWERWGTPHITPDVVTAVSKVRQPLVNPLTEEVYVYGERQHVGMEAIMLAIAERLDLPNFGEDAFGPGQPLKRVDDWFVRMVANLAKGDKPGTEVPDASAEEIELFYKARRHLPAHVFDPDRWKAIVGEKLWPKVVYVLNRGGRFEDFERAYKGDKVRHQYKGQFNLYAEHVALAKHPGTGKRFSGLPVYEPVKDFHGRPVDDPGYPLHLITYKEIVGGQSRTPGNYWSQGLMLPENYILMNSRDAEALGLKNGDRARIVSVSNSDGVWNLRNGQKVPIAGKVKVAEGIRPGVVAVSWHSGHWAYGASDQMVDGQTVRGDRRRAKGLCPNAAMRVDPVLGDMCLTDPIGGSSSFYDTKVKVIPA